MSGRTHLVVLTPSLRISGGNKETIRLLQEMMAGAQATSQVEVLIASMWKHPHEVDTGGIPVVYLSESKPIASRALWQLFSITLAHLRLLRRLRTGAEHRIVLLLTHYSSYLLSWVAPRLQRVCFTQDMEWMFMPKGWRRALLKRAILRTNRKASVLTTNAFVTRSLEAEGIRPLGEASIWADPAWLTEPPATERDIDVLMLPRGSGIKRLDLYLRAIELFRAHTGLRLAVITPDTSVKERVPHGSAQVYLRPSDEEMRALFARSRVFLLLSDVEGFGLPPLEAMGGGCVPACRDSGGVRCYMTGAFAEMLFPFDMPIEQIVSEVASHLQVQSLPQPATAQQAFATGLQASRASRAECLQRLRALLYGTPQ